MIRTLIFIIILLFLPIYSFASSPNGKGLICRCISIEKCPKRDSLFWNTYISPNGMPSEIAISFRDNKAIYYYIRVINDKVEFIKEVFGAFGAKYSFYTTKDSIRWKTSNWNDTLIDRKTLTYKTISIYPKRHNRDNEIHFRRCEVFDNNNLFKNLEKLVIEYQNEHNKLLKDNKI